MTSCTGTLKKSWIISEFNEKKTFSIVSEKGKSYTTAIIKIEGNVDKRICFKLEDNTELDWCNHFSTSDSEIQFKTDFYGVGKFSIYMLPSPKAKGELKLTIELPYNTSL